MSWDEDPHFVEAVETVEFRADPDDDDYNPPQAGGCWICYRGNGHDDESMALDLAFDTYYHPECLDRVGVDSVTEFERSHSPR